MSKNNRVLDYTQFLEIIHLKEAGYSHRAIARELGYASRQCIDYMFTTDRYADFFEELNKSQKPLAAGTLESRIKSRERLTPNKRYVFTSAQNNTNVHTDFYNNLVNYCELNDAELIVSTFHYNKSGFQNATKEDLWFDPRITKYIRNESIEVANNLIFCGELNILPTAVKPFSGLHNYTGENSAIVPHAKVQLESVAVGADKPVKMLYTTGTITQRNYIEMKAGQKASFNHVFGALVVEVNEDGSWYARQLIAESSTGNFYDIAGNGGAIYYHNGNLTTVSPNVAALNWGDMHAAKLDQTVAENSWRSPDSILHKLKPLYQFVHDVYDHQSRNHHNIGNPHVMFRLHCNGNESVRSEIELTAKVIGEMVTDFSTPVVVNSNHDMALERWLREGDYKRDPVNAITFLELQLLKYHAIQSGNEGCLLEQAINLYTEDALRDKVIFLKEDESFILQGIECGEHGHAGSNGSRGGLSDLVKRGIKTNTGHSHAAAIMNGSYVAGVSGQLRMGYNKGASSWTHSHILTYPNGKRTIITLHPNGSWRKM